MANLVALRFDTLDGADKGLELAVSLQKQKLLHIKDAATVSWPAGRKRPKTRHHPGIGVEDASVLDGAFWGLMFGILFVVPVVGVEIGAGIGALIAHLVSYGIDEKFVKQVRAKVTEGTSGLFLLLGAVSADKVIEAFKGAPHFELITSNLTHEQEEKLKEAFG